MPERTPDGRYIVVDGRRWRATDPAIPEQLRAELVSELSAARRAVGRAKRGEDDEAESSSRRRVHDAKVALGERGRPWWFPPDSAAIAERSAAATRALLRHRHADSSICPSDIARVVGGATWRDAMNDVRAAVDELRKPGQVALSRGGVPVESFEGGPVRVRRGPAFPDGTIRAAAAAEQ